MFDQADIKDIFISYKNDGIGNIFASKICADLESRGFSVYYNKEKQRSGSFPKRIRFFAANCKDFLLLVSAGCLEQLLRHEKVDWIREELLTAKDCGRKIIPLLMPGVSMPKDKDIFSEDLRFLPDCDSIALPDPTDTYDRSPLEFLISWMDSKPEREPHKRTSNSNPAYDVHADFLATLQRAKEGDIEAMYEVGCMYYYGFASAENSEATVNYAEAGRWLKKVSDANHALSAKADNIIGKLYYIGAMPYEEQSFEKSLEYYDRSKDVVPSVYYERVGFLKSESVGSKFDFNEILDFFDSCGTSCSNTTKNNMAKFYINYGLFDKAIKILESIEECYPDAEYKLGLLYQRGLHCDPPMPDIFRAEHHYQNAASCNHLDSIHALGLLSFRAPNGYKKNFRKARAYFKDAAEKGHRGAQYDYAWMCAYGLGGDRHIHVAIEFFEKAAQRGHLLSARELATLYQLEECRNYQKAFEWAERGANSGDAVCEFVLGNLYFFGRGCNSDVNKAMIWYKNAQEHGIYQAQIMIEKINRMS